jgi:hypothetical protein
VELSGASGSAKSEIMLNVAVQYTLPTELGGEGKSAVFFDLGKHIAACLSIMLMQSNATHTASLHDLLALAVDAQTAGSVC